MDYADLYLEIPAFAGMTINFIPMNKEILVESVKGTLAAKVTADNHQMYVDEPAEYGGTDKGPDPYVLILSSLGACTVITLQMYAQRKNLNIEKVEVLLNHFKVHAEDCKMCEEDPNAKLDRIERKIKVFGNFTQEQLEKFNDIAQKCPVHKTLEAGVNIETSTVVG